MARAWEKGVFYHCNYIIALIVTLNRITSLAETFTPNFYCNAHFTSTFFACIQLDS